MILIFGGAYQGKLAYAVQRFNLSEADIYRCSENDTAMPQNKKAIYEIDKWILALIKNKINAEESMERFIVYNNNSIVICNDISCGVVPIDPELRAWRETVGRSLAALSQKSDEVIRLFCGIPSIIKKQIK
ncbi:MAG: bifunctional adenosylcobinamide kinase/adenosylcobinamide-phosphate guanylyltransferase [Treponema sp.]|nr:bifunctional adenosylcobinamide kinase/adenosylcobinamide-phosphate guanylyltransferase [Treponema sp.]